MNILNKVTWQAMLRNKARTVVTIIGIIVSTAMFTAVTTLGVSLWTYLVDMQIYSSGDYYLQYDYAPEDHLEKIQQDDRVSQLGDLRILGYVEFPYSNSDHIETCMVAAGDEAFYDMLSIVLEEGRLPQSSSEIVISRNVYYHLQGYGLPCELGDTVELNVEPEYDADTLNVVLPSVGKAFTKTYTIVGIAEHFTRLNDYTVYLSHLFTYADGSEENAIWHRIYVKTADPKDAYDLLRETPNGICADVNDSLLELYGATKYSNYNTIISAICGVLIAIIMVGSVSLIYNAFSISVSERAKQFGLLSSIGATKKQIRKSVFTEAMLLSLFGIPLGLLSGYGGISITLTILAERINLLLATGNGTVTLRPVLSATAFICAAVVALITVLISAAIPSRKAAKVSPVEAIRQKNDYRVPKKSIKFGKLTYRLFGLPGVLSKKYYRVSHKKYRATVISLVISIVLFISAASISQTIRQTVDRAVAAENYDMWCSGDLAELEKVRNQAFVSKSAYTAEFYGLTFVPDSMRSKEFLDCWDDLSKEYTNLSKNIPDVRMIYLEDAVFEAYLKDHGIAPEDYFDTQLPTALVCTKEVTAFLDDGTGNFDRYTFLYDPFDASGEMLQIFKDCIPSGLDPFESAGSGMNTYLYTANEQGEPILSIAPIVEAGNGAITEDWSQRIDYLIRWENADGVSTASYYRVDTATGEAAQEPECVERIDFSQIRIGATIKDLPFGISASAIDSHYYTYLILPMSQAPEARSEELCFNVSDYTAAKTYLNRELGENNYHDYRQSQENNRTLLLLINVFSYGFIILISLISVANVFNTISTNVALRKRDFGMLRSTGFREKDLLRMMNYECLTYGFQSLLWGLPTGLVISYFIYLIDRDSATVSFLPPWAAMGISAISVFIVVFTTMFYAMSKLRKDSPIDAIRMENL